MFPRAAFLALALAACAHHDSQSAPDASRPDAAPTDATTNDGPITAPADTWTWVPVTGTRCVHGAETGIGVNLHPGATRLLIFLQGGGSCTQCWGTSESDKVGTPTHYDADSFTAETDLRGQLLLGRDDDNPLADANLVFIPYCTGDAHGGTATRTERGRDGLLHDDYFWGATDVDLILQRLVPTFPSPSRVWVAGSSAGGVATTINFARIRAAFGVRTDTINDSGAPLAPSATAADDEATVVQLWGVSPPAACPACTTRAALHAYNRQLAPESRFALLSNDYDNVVAESNFGTPAQNPDYLLDFHAALHTFIDGLDSQSHALVSANTPETATHVVMNKPKNQTAIGAWLRLMITDDPAWANASL